MGGTTQAEAGSAASGRFLLRIEPGLHEAPRAAARAAGLSLNDHCGAKLLDRDWDRTPLTWDGRPVEPHFARLPAPDDPLTGLWPEVAIDGIVLFERCLVVSRHLARVRRRIATGELTPAKARLLHTVAPVAPHVVVESP